MHARSKPNLRSATRMCRPAALLGAVIMLALVMSLGSCGGPDLTVNGSVPATATAVGGTPTPGTCSGVGQACDDVTVFCCSPLTCVGGGVCE